MSGNVKNTPENWFSLELIFRNYLKAEISGKLKKFAETNDEVLQWMKELLLESFILMRKIGDKVYLSEEENCMVTCSPFYNIKWQKMIIIL